MDVEAGLFKVVILCLEFSDMAAESQSVFFGKFSDLQFGLTILNMKGARPNGTTYFPKKVVLPHHN